MDPAESRADRFSLFADTSAAGAALRVHAQLQIARTAGISGDSPEGAKNDGLDGGRRSLRRTPLRPELCFSTDQKWAINRKSVNFTLRLIFRTLWSKFEDRLLRDYCLPQEPNDCRLKKLTVGRDWLSSPLLKSL